MSTFKAHLMRVFFLTLLVMLLMASAAHAAPTPVTTLTVDNKKPLIGAKTFVDISFENAGAPGQTGFGPYIDLYIDSDGESGDITALPFPEPGDGLSLDGAPSMGGQALSKFEFTCDALSTPIPHPLLGLNKMYQSVPCPAGKKLIVIELPFGSFAAGQPKAMVRVNLDTSNLATNGYALSLEAHGGFRFGADALNNPDTDPRITGATVSDTITPQLWKLTKHYIGPECETATGPNYLRHYRLDLDIAPGQTVTDLQIGDVLPSWISYRGISASTAGGSIAAQPPLNVPVPGANNTVIYHWPTITAAAPNVAVDASVTIDFHVPMQNDLGALVLAGHADRNVLNQGQATGDWIPLDLRDALQAGVTTTSTAPSSGVCAGAGDTTQFDAEALAIQKSEAITNDVGPNGPSPGDTVTFTIQGQVSDFYALSSVLVDDVMSDGLRRVTPAEHPEIAISGVGFNSPAAPFAGTSYTYNVDGAAPSAARWQFDISSELVARALHGSGYLLGGCVPIAGTADPSGCATNDGATTFTITYRALIQQDFVTQHLAGSVHCGETVPPGGGTQAVDGDDSLCNSASVSADVLTTDTFALDGTTGDTTSDEIRVRRGAISKSVYAINGSTSLPTDNTVKPGDTVTYKITYDLKPANVENFVIQDFLPQPVYHASTEFATTTTVDPVSPGNAVLPVAGKIQFEASDTYAALIGVNPLVLAPVVDAVAPSVAAANSLRIDFGSPSTNPAQEAVVSLLYTVTVQSDPHADELILANQASAFTNNTVQTSMREDAFARIRIREPELRILKGVAATSRFGATPAATFSPGRPAQFIEPLAAGLSFTPPINPTMIDVGTNFDSDVDNLDANDTVRWLVTVVNDGGFDAHDVMLCDTLPAAGMLGAGSVTNFEVRNGAGTPLAYSGTVADFFSCGTGIELTAALPGSDDDDPADASDDPLSVVVITYDLPVDSVPSVVNSAMTNTAQITAYSNVPAGSNFVDPASPIKDTASAKVRLNPAIAKTAINSSSAHTTPHTTLTIGERIQYNVRITPRQGTTQNMVLQDTLDSGLRFANLATYPVQVSVSGAVTCSDGTAGDCTTLPGIAGQVTVDGADGVLTVDFGNVTSITDGGVDYIDVTYWAVLIDTGSNTNGATNVRNSARVNHDDCGGPAPEQSCPAASRVAASVVEPLVTVAKSVDGVENVVIDSADSNEWVIDVAVPAGRPDAFDVRLNDTVPAGLTKTANTLEIVGPGSPGTVYTCLAFDALLNGSCTEGANTISVSWDQMSAGASNAWKVRFDTTLDNATAVAGAVLTNTANIDWRSVPNVASQCAVSVFCVDREYSASDTASVTVLAPVPVKSITGTSAAHTLGQNVTIGEQITYQVVIPVAEGLTKKLRVRDTLRAGLAFTDASDVSVALALDTTDIPGTSSPLVPASVVITNAANGAAGSQLFIDIGNVTNADNDASIEAVVITYKAAVVNHISVDEGDTSGNSVVTIFEPAVGPDVTSTPATAPDVTVVEPQATIAKIMQKIGGNRVKISLTVTNPASPPATSISAFDLDVTDALNTAMLEADASTTVSCAPIACSGSNVNIGTDTITATIAQLDPGQSTVVSFDVPVSGAYVPPTTITNSASLDWTTLPGVVSSACNYPADCAERSYNDTDAASLPVNSLGGFVWHDVNNDGVRDGGEACIDGVTITLTGTDQFGLPVGPLTSVTGSGALACGEYAFDTLPAGSFVIVETQPATFIDGKDSLGTLTPSPVPPATNGANPVQDRFEVSLPINIQTDGVNYDFGELLPSTLSGRVWGEENGGTEDGVYNGADQLLGGVTITLTGTDDRGDAVSLTTTTDPAGAYTFANLRPGTYAITQTQPVDWASGGANVGTGAFANGSTSGTNRFEAIILRQDQDGVNFDFWELVRVDVAITKEIIPVAPAGGIVGMNTSFIWRVKLTNNGPSAATNIQFSDDLALLGEQNLAVTAIDPQPGTTCSAWANVASPNLTCITANLARAASTYVDITVRVDSKPAISPEQIRNDVAITGVDQVDTDPANNADNDQVVVRGGDVSITKDAPITRASVGERFTWTLTVTNNGPGTDPHVQVSDTMPARALLLSTTASKGTCAASTVTSATIECDLGVMAAGETVVIELEVIATEAGIYRNQAVVTPGGIDENSANNQAEHTVSVTAPGAGDCTIEGDGQINGTDGDDVICGGSGPDIIECGVGGNTTIVGGGGGDTITCMPEDCSGELVIIGGSGNDVIEVACPGAVVDGGGGDDIIRVPPDFAGSMTLCGGDGNDRIYGGSGSDLIDGGAGNDVVFGRAGHDRIYGGTGHDRLNGEAGNDRIYGGVGNDWLNGGIGNDWLFGEAGQDRLIGGKGRDNAHGGNGNDLFFMRDRGRDRIIGGRGRDTLTRDRRIDRWTSIERLL